MFYLSENKLDISKISTMLCPSSPPFPIVVRSSSEGGGSWEHSLSAGRQVPQNPCFEKENKLFTRCIYFELPSIDNRKTSLDYSPSFSFVSFIHVL